MQSRPEKIQQRNLIKLTLDSKLKIKTDDLKVFQSKPILYGVTVTCGCCHSTVLDGAVFFSPELEQVDSSMPLELKA